MKKMKKIFALLLAVVMVLAMGVTAFADGESGNETNTGTITVSNATVDETYTIYKIFDLTYPTNETGQLTDSVTYTYTTNATNVVPPDDNTGKYTVSGDELLSALLNGYTVTSGEDSTPPIESPFTLTETTDAGVYNVTIKKGESPADVVKFLAALVNGNVLTKTTSSRATTSSNETTTTVKFTNLAYGYYYVTSSLGSVITLTSTTPDAEIIDKNEIPFDKVDDAESVEVGQTVNYTITGEVPDYTSFEQYTYKVTDTMSEGLTFNKDVKVYVDDKELANNDYTLTCNNNDSETSAPDFTLSINVLEKEMTIGGEIKITYSATVNDDAVSTISENSAKLEYSNDPTDETSTKTKTDKETVYSAKIVIDKYDSNNQSTTLSGASFVLYRLAVKNDDDTYSFTITDENGATSEVTETTDDAVEVYYNYTAATDKTPAKVKWVALGEKETLDTVLGNNYTGTTYVTEKTTNNKGATDFPGLEDGTYYLLETAAPTGYNQLRSAIPITINGADATVNNLNSLTHTEEVANNIGSLLPSTGGIGTTIFYILGAILVVGAGVMLVVRRRMNAEK